MYRMLIFVRFEVLAVGLIKIQIVFDVNAMLISK
jgi:hypothetical protein